MDISLKKEIYNLLKKHYIYFNANKWNKFLNGSSFESIWKKEHGGYLYPELLEFYRKSVDPTVPKEIPTLKNKTLLIPTCVSNNKSYQRRYIKVANDILLNYTGDELTLDFRNNGGGHPQVMIASLLPLFNISKRKILSYSSAKGKFKRDIIKENGCITSAMNNGAFMCGSKLKNEYIRKLKILVNVRTASSAEQSIICLFSLEEFIDIRVIGKSAGMTTTIKYFELSNGGGLEIPVGIMADYQKNEIIGF